MTDILVVPRKKLFSNKYFEGFIPDAKNKFSEIILENFEYQKRSEELEKNNDFKQIIPYVWIIDKQNKKVFLYKRAISGGEGRLHDKYSGGVGGHIDKEPGHNPIYQAMMRELREEVIMKNYPEPIYVGYLNDDSNDVGKVHFGVVAVVDTDQEVKPAEDMASGEFYSLEDIENIFQNNEIESWTKLSWPFVKELIQKA